MGAENLYKDFKYYFPYSWEQKITETLSEIKKDSKEEYIKIAIQAIYKAD